MTVSACASGACSQSALLLSMADFAERCSSEDISSNLDSRVSKDASRCETSAPAMTVDGLVVEGLVQKSLVTSACP